jgi:PAS domain S-box-containing protein
MGERLKKWVPPVKSSTEEKMIVDLLKTFSSALRKIPLYPATHPMVKESISKLFQGIAEFFSNYGALSLDVFEHNLLVCEQAFSETQSAARDLAADLKKISVEGIRFLPGLAEQELESFLKLLTLKPENIKERGGMKALLASESITHVALAEVRYARIREEEEVTKKGGKDQSAEVFAAEPLPDTAASAAPAASEKDIVGMVSDFFSGSSEKVPDKEVLEYEFKKHSRRLVKQLLKLIGPEKAVEDVLKIIEERFEKTGFAKEEQDFYIEKFKEETLRLREPKVSKKQLEQELKRLKEENKRLKTLSCGVEKQVREAVAQATEELAGENRKIKKEKQRINSVLRHVAEGLVIVDSDGKVLLLNPAAEELLGIPKENKIGQHILEGLRDEQMVSFSKDKQQEIEIELAGPNESTKKTLRASTAVIESKEGETIGLVSVLTDITKQKELERMKDTFVSNVTHDLRAPLISIQKSLSIFLDNVKDSLPQEQKQFLEIASNNASRLTNLVNDLLDVAKLEAGRTRLEYTRFSVESVASSVFDMLSAWAGSRGVALQKTGLEDIAVDADAKLLNQVFTNLVGNAIKFTREGGSVSISAEVVGKEVKMTVADTGCGIPADSLERIFSKFEQARNVPVSGALKGTGLGLSIVKEIVHLHGGKIWVESEEGKGSRFIFIIPKEKEVLDIRD